MAIPVVLTSSTSSLQMKTPLCMSASDTPVMQLATNRRLQQCLQITITQLGPHNSTMITLAHVIRRREPKMERCQRLLLCPEVGFWLATKQFDWLISHEYVATDPAEAVLLADKLVTHWRRLGNAIKPRKLKQSSNNKLLTDKVSFILSNKVSNMLLYGLITV